MKSTSTVDRRGRAREVGEEDQRALQHADEHDAVGVVGADLGGEASDALAAMADSSRSVAGARGVVLDRRRHSASDSRTASRSSAVRSRRPSAPARRARPAGGPAPRGCAGGRTAAAPGRRAPLRARRTSGTCAGGEPRRPARRSRPRRCATSSASSSYARFAADLECRAEQAEALELLDLSGFEAGDRRPAHRASTSVRCRSSASSPAGSSGGRVGTKTGALLRAGLRVVLRPGARAALDDAPDRVGRSGGVAAPAAPPGGDTPAAVSSASPVPAAEVQVMARGGWSSGELFARLELVEALLDDLQRQEVLLLLVEDPPQPGEVAGRRTSGTPTACARGR